MFTPNILTNNDKKLQVCLGQILSLSSSPVGFALKCLMKQNLLKSQTTGMRVV